MSVWSRGATGDRSNAVAVAFSVREALAPWQAGENLLAAQTSCPAPLPGFVLGLRVPPVPSGEGRPVYVAFGAILAIIRDRIRHSAPTATSSGRRAADNPAR
jgi:hypothetical protein